MKKTMPILLCALFLGTNVHAQESEPYWLPTGVQGGADNGVGFTAEGEVIAGQGSDLMLLEDDSARLIGKSEPYPNFAMLFRTFVLQKNGDLFAGISAGTQRSSDNGRTWKISSTWNINFTSLAVDSFGVLYAGSESLLTVSRDNGVTWQMCTRDLDTKRGAIGIGPDNTIYAASHHKIFKSTDHCQTWETLFSVLSIPPRNRTLNYANDIELDSEGRMYIAGDRSDMFRSNGDESKYELMIREGSQRNSSVTQLAITAADVMYISNAGAFRSFDGGDIWEDVYDGFNGALMDIQISPAGYIYAASHSSGVYRFRERTVDYPVLWGIIRECDATRFLIADDSVTAVTLIENESDNIELEYIDTPPAPIVRLRTRLIDPDRPGHWTVHAVNAAGRDTIYSGAVTPNPPQAAITRKPGTDTLVATGGYIFQWYKGGEPIDSAEAWFYAPETSGIYSVTATDTSGCTAMSQEYQFTITGAQDRLVNVGEILEQNYPNPFSGETSIVFTMTQAGQARLTITDIMGREVARLVDEFRPLGRHTISFPATNLPAGIYHCRLEAPGGVYRRAMVAIK